MSDDTIDVGIAQPEAPMFTIIERGQLVLVDSATGAGVRPCEHRRYVLDDEWCTVTCAECKERLNPYAILRINASIIEKIQMERASKERAEHDMLVADVRIMLKRSCFTDDERNQYRRRTYIWGKDALAAARSLHKEVQTRVDAAHDARMARRRSRSRGHA